MSRKSKRPKKAEKKRAWKALLEDIDLIPTIQSPDLKPEFMSAATEENAIRILTGLRHHQLALLTTKHSLKKPGQP